MDPADVAYQQILAAWISAVAAAVQAIGAIVAIRVSIRLASASAEREREADAAATRRMEAADRAAVEREVEAVRAAENRAERAKNDAHNNLIKRITSMGVLVVEECQPQIEKSKQRFASTTGTIMGGFESRRLIELRKGLPSLKQETGDVELLGAISNLQDVIEDPRTEGLGVAGYVAALQSQLDCIYGALHEIDQLSK